MAKTNKGFLTLGFIFLAFGLLMAFGILPFAGVSATCPPGQNCTSTNTTNTTSNFTTATEPLVTASSSTTQTQATSTITTLCGISSCGSSTVTTTQAGYGGQVNLQITVYECSYALVNSCLRLPGAQVIVQVGGQNLYSCQADANGYCSIYVPANLGIANICYAAGGTIVDCNYNVPIGTTTPIVQNIDFYTSGFSSIKYSVVGFACSGQQGCQVLASTVNAIFGGVIAVLGVVLIARSKKK